MPTMTTTDNTTPDWMHSPAHNVSLGDSYYIDENYPLAVEAYSKAIASSSKDNSINTETVEGSIRFRALSHRSAAFLHLASPVEALNDAKSAIALGGQHSLGLLTGEEEACHMRMGIASYELQHYEEARNAFDRAANLALLDEREPGKYQQWMRRCDEKLCDEIKNAGKHTDGTVPDDVPLSTPPPTTTAAASPNGTPKSAGVATTTVTPATTHVGTNKKRPSMPKYQYYQNDTYMTIAILESNVQPERIKVDFALDKLTVILNKDGVDFTVIHGTLYDGVDVSKCRVKIMDEKVLIKLRKRDKLEWHELFGTGVSDTNEKMDVEADETKKKPVSPVSGKAVVSDSPTANRVRPYASQRDWVAIERELQKEEESAKPEGDEALNKLFQVIYSKADENTRRAMVKSFQTSGGTVLSTNWDEVAKTDYEKDRQAPKGMEWKTWEGDKLPQKND